MNLHHPTPITVVSIAAEYPELHLTDADYGVARAYADRMERHPEYLHAAVRGSHEWNDSMCAEDLCVEASDLLTDKLGEINLCGPRAGDKDRLLNLIAAATAAFWVAGNQQDAARDFDDAWENGRGWNINGGQRA